MIFIINIYRNKCNTSFSCTFDYKIHFWYNFHDSMSSLKSKRQFQSQISKNLILINTDKKHFFNVIFIIVDMIRAQKWVKPYF